ncbi:MAG: hypothetical protein KIS76_10340 [Pyrinomonadaceae bacterium]|nr:hypothetical protein [Pyrinomonadaceae bacterium]
MDFKKFSALLRLCGLILLLCFSAFAQKTIPAPKDVIGFTPGEDKKLASWASVVDYFQKLDAASDRVNFQEIGKTTEGKPFVYATISTPENLKNLQKYIEINNKLADPRIIKRNDKTAQDLIKQGKTFVLITCGIHSTEVGSTLSSMLIAEKLAKAEDAETKRILENTIIVLVPSLNPDGVDIVKNWYDKTLGTKFEGTSPPELYQKYVGHDNNRDWYAFTQVETQLTVDKIHNVFHPQIVHDIHQQGANGARLFLPPYEPPVEPNVPKELVEGYTELGLSMAKNLREQGFEGITTGTTYDAWTPARAYSHYHGGVRILSETASANLASPIEIKLEDLRGRRGFDAQKESENFGPVWKGGKWGMGDITKYMTSAAFSLLEHASDNRASWLERFYAIGKEATRPRKDGELNAFAVEIGQGNLESILERAGVEAERVQILNAGINGEPILLVKMAQPYGSFAKAILENQKYPNLKDEKGNPISPYDVTAHTISLLEGVKVTPIYETIRYPKAAGFSIDNGPGCGTGKDGPKIISAQIYRSEIPSMDEGWTRFIMNNGNWILFGRRGRECEELKVSELRNENILQNAFDSKTVIFPDQSPRQILNGYPKGSMPDEYTGGVGAEGVENLKKFVEVGGTLVFLNRASDFAIEQFDLPVRDVTKGLSNKDFYIPGSILRTELDTKHPIAKGMPAQSIAWFEDSPAFEIMSVPPAVAGGAKIEAKDVDLIAKYPQKTEDILLSGWALGAEKLAGKAALVSIKMGKGKIVLFGFRPQYRGQSLATFPLLFNAISE